MDINEKINKKIKAIIFIAFVLISGLSVQYFTTLDNKKESDYLNEVCTDTTIGIIDNIYKYKSSNNKYTPTKIIIEYYYILNYTKYIDNAKYYADAYANFNHKYEINEQVTIHYNPNNPKENYFGDKPEYELNETHRIWVLILYLMILILLIGYIIDLVILKKKQKQEVTHESNNSFK